MIGAGGFAGSHLRRAAEAAGLRVVGTSRSPDGPDLHCDLLDPESVEATLRGVAPNLVANLAGVASVGRSWKRPAETFAVNAAGVLNLLEAMASEAPEAHLLCVSSSEVYGEVEPDRLPVTEDHPVRPVSPYGSSKAAMELLCSAYTRSHGLRVAVVRAFNQLGPGQSEDFAASGFARQIAAAELRGEDEVTIAAGNLSAARDFIDVRDAAGAYLAISGRELTGIYNLCSGEAVKIESLIDRLRDITALGVTTETEPELTRQVDAPLVYGSAERLRAATGWEPRIALEQAVADLLDWWRAELSRPGDRVAGRAER